jgi:hypothetical protein
MPSKPEHLVRSALRRVLIQLINLRPECAPAVGRLVKKAKARGQLVKRNVIGDMPLSRLRL